LEIIGLLPDTGVLLLTALFDEEFVTKLPVGLTLANTKSKWIAKIKTDENRR